jgi:hypothetical protein
MVSAARPIATTGSGCTSARLSIQGSRGRTQTMRSGSTPLSCNHTIASVAVLPDPVITYSPGAATMFGSSPTEITSAPSLTANGAGVVAGIVGERYAASTTRRRGLIRTRSPDTRDLTT